MIMVQLNAIEWLSMMLINIGLCSGVANGDPIPRLPYTQTIIAANFNPWHYTHPKYDHFPNNLQDLYHSDQSYYPTSTQHAPLMFSIERDGVGWRLVGVRI